MIFFHKKTSAFLDELFAVTWFANVGKLKTEERIVPIYSWHDAQLACTSEIFDLVCAESQNELTIFLSKHYKIEFGLWNLKASSLKKFLEPLVAKKREETVLLGKLPADFRYKFFGDILGICMALEYSDFFSSDFYSEIASWYLKGNFPCGWRGDVFDNFENGFQIGSLIVY